MFTRLVNNSFRIALLVLLAGFLYVAWQYDQAVVEPQVLEVELEQKIIVELEETLVEVLITQETLPQEIIPQEVIPQEVLMSADAGNGFVCYSVPNSIVCFPWYFGIAPWERVPDDMLLTP